MLCSIVAGVLHFVFLVAFAWMCLEGIQLYVMLIEVFEVERSRIRWYYAAGYGTSSGHFTALAANPRPLQTPLSFPACIASGNFILEFPSINSRSRLFSRWRMRARSVEQTTSLAAHACVNLRIGEFMLGNSRTKLPAQCMLGRIGEFEGVAICNAQRCQPCI